MKRSEQTLPAEGDLARYDWSKAKRGRHAAKAAKATELLRILEPDVAAAFPDSSAVNRALRALLTVNEALGHRRARRPRVA